MCGLVVLYIELLCRVALSQFFLYLEAIGDLELLCVCVLHPVVQQHCDHYGDGHTEVSQGSSCLNNPMNNTKLKLDSVQRWKLQRIKIQRLPYRYRFLNPYPILWIFCWKSQKFGKSLGTFGSRIFVLRFLKSIDWYGFSYGFLVVLTLFLQHCV